MILRLLPILGITFIDILGFSILLPLLPFFVKQFGASDAIVGAVFASYSLAQFVAGPLWGNASDRIGRKAVLVVSQIGSTIAWTMLGFAPSIAWVFGARVLEGFSGGNFGVTQAYVADLVPPEQRGRAFAYVGAAFSAGFVFGPAFGGWLASRTSLQTPFFAAAALQALTLILTLVLLPESRAKADAASAPVGPRAILRALRAPDVGPVLRLRLVAVLGLYGWFGVMALALHAQVGWGPSQLSYVFAVFGVLQVLLQVFAVGPAVERLRPLRGTTVGLALLALAFALVPFAHGIVMMAVMLALFGVGMSVQNAAFPALASDAAPDDQRGTVLGVVGGLDSVAGFAMPPVTTAVLGAYGVGPASAIPAALVACGAALGALQTRRGAQAAAAGAAN